MRRRITDAWARLGALTPAAGLAAIRRGGGAAPSWDRNSGPAEQPSWDRNSGPAENPSWDRNSGAAQNPSWNRNSDPAENPSWDRNSGAGQNPSWDRNDDSAEQPSWDRDDDSAEQPFSGRDDTAEKPSSNRNKLLVAGAGVLAVVAVGGVFVAPRLLGPSDPGCKAYAGTGVTAYNKTIDDLNAQASQAVLSADMSTAITDLSGAVAQAQSASVKSALNGLLTELKLVKSDVQSGAVPATTVSALNAASTAADKAC